MKKRPPETPKHVQSKKKFTLTIEEFVALMVIYTDGGAVGNSHSKSRNLISHLVNDSSMDTCRVKLIDWPEATLVSLVKKRLLQPIVDPMNVGKPDDILYFPLKNKTDFIRNYRNEIKKWSKILNSIISTGCKSMYRY